MATLHLLLGIHRGSMFLLSKLLPLLLLPLGVALLLLWGTARVPAWPAIAALDVLATPALATARPQAVVVLGGGRYAAPGPARASEWNDADRFFGGLEAYQQLRQQGQRLRLIFAGGWWPTQPQLQPEGDVMRQQALDLGIPASDLASTARVRNTAEEARMVASMMPRGSSVVLVTSAFHIPRTRRLFEQQGLRVIPAQVDFRAPRPWHGNSLGQLQNWPPSPLALAQSCQALHE